MEEKQLEDYNKIIESLSIKYIKAQNIKLTKPVTIRNFQDPENTLIVVKQGEIHIGEFHKKATVGDIVFIPGGYTTPVTYGYGSTIELDNEEISTRNEEFFASDSDNSGLRSVGVDNFNYMTFESNIFDTVNFFKTLDIQPFLIKSEKISDIVSLLIREDMGFQEGRNRIIAIKTEEVVIEIIRYILDNHLFVEQMVTNATYFKDPRLLRVFDYVSDNLNGDLSNKVLAKIASVSDDYVGQYFKMLTGMNPQDYIEYQRMQYALELLRTTKKSIREIGKESGYKDTAYFCRRFKMQFGIPAGKMRKRETLMNIK